MWEYSSSVSPPGCNLSRPPSLLQSQHHLPLRSLPPVHLLLLFFPLPISVHVFIPRVSSHFSLHVPAPFVLWVLHPAGTEGQIAPINLLQCLCTVCICHSPFIFVRGPVCGYLNVLCITSVVFSFAGRVQGILCEMCWYLCDRFFSYLVWCGVHSHALFYESLLCRDCKLTCSPLPLIFLLFFCPFITSLDHFSLSYLHLKLLAFYLYLDLCLRSLNIY